MLPLLGWLGSAAVGAAKFLFGSGAPVQGQQAPSVAATIADRLLPMSQKEQAQEVAEDLEGAREYQPADLPKAELITQQGLLPFILSWLIAALNSIVDALNHLIRPGGFILVLGGFFGWWKMPDPGVLDEFWQKVFWIMLTFFYGGRMILKDLPALIKAFRR